MGLLRMRWISKVAAVVSAGLALFAATGSQGATYLLDYTSTGGNPLVANLTVTTTDVLNGIGGYDVTNVAGNVDGDTVTGLIANPAAPNWTYSADGLFMIDNVFFQSAPNVSWYGLLFAGASGSEYNLFSDNASTYELYKARSGVGYLANSYGTLAMSQVPTHPLGGFAEGGGVPEPAAWTMLILGFGAVGASLRRQRRAAAAL